MPAPFSLSRRAKADLTQFIAQTIAPAATIVDTVVDTSGIEVLDIMVRGNDGLATAAGDIAVSVLPRPDANFWSGSGQLANEKSQSGISGGNTYLWARYDVRALNTVVVRVSNNNATVPLAVLGWVGRA